MQFGFKYSEAVEYVHMVDGGGVEDGRINVTGPDFDAVPGRRRDAAGD